MNRIFISISAALISLAAYAQPGVKDIHPAGPANGKIMTMEDAILNRSLSPAVPQEYSEKMAQLAEEGIVFSKRPEGNTEVLKGQSLYYKDAEGNLYLVARSENSQITYGQSVSRNEFGINGGTFWSDDRTKLAFYRKDESMVTEFPLLDITTRTGSLRNIKYPMNGMSSEVITLGVYDTKTMKTVYMKVNDFGQDRYLTNISWGPDGKYIFIQVLDRTQEHMKLNMYDAQTGEYVKTILTEDNDNWVEPLDPLYFIGDNYHFIYRTNNRDGYRNLYLCDTLGTVRRVTPCDADVEFTDIVGEDLYYMSSEISPAESHLFRVKITDGKGKKALSAADAKVGKPERLTMDRGWHSVAISTDGKWFIDSYSSFNTPLVRKVVSTDLKTTRFTLRSEDPLKDYATGEVDFGTVKSADGKFDNWYRLYKPTNFDPSKKYPVIVYVYGGPHSQMVHDSWLGQIRMWEMYMAQHGYIVYVQDNRGTDCQGIEYEQAINRQCGQAEMADQMEGIKMLKSLPYVDADRIGVHGWSYGGFMTISLITNYPDVFKVGVAGGPVIDWKWYEIMYGERYMDTEMLNPDGFAKTSLINKAKDLKGKLLICQGAIDNTVVWEHSLSFIRECIVNNVQVDYFPYPCAEHNVQGKDRVHLMDKVTNYFNDYL